MDVDCTSFDRFSYRQSLCTYSSDRSGPVGCLSVFLHWPAAADQPLSVTPRPADVILCHNVSVGRRSWYSRSRRMALEFVSEGNPEGHRGFSAAFKFVDRGKPTESN